MEEKKKGSLPENGQKTAAEPVVSNEIGRRHRKKQGSGAKWLLLSVFLLLAVGLICYVNEFSVDIDLVGDAEMILEYGNSYQEPGARAVIRGKYFLRNGFPLKDVEVSSTGNLQEEKLGSDKPILVFQTDFTYAEGAVSSMYGVVKRVDRELEIFDGTHYIPQYINRLIG